MSAIQKTIKTLITLLILIAIAVSGYLAGILIKYQIDVRKSDKEVKKFQESLEKPYKEDIYGGKTPEETWQMFLNALKAGDIDLASKYFAVEHQEKAKKWLEELKENNELEKTIKEMEGLRKSKREALENQRNYFYNYFDEEFQQELSSQVVFYLNPYTKIWKIVW